MSGLFLGTSHLVSDRCESVFDFVVYKVSSTLHVSDYLVPTSASR